MKTYRVTLPLPSRDLSPNARVHWARKSRVTTAARRKASMAYLIAALPRSLGKRDLLLEWVFYWPDRRRRDDDNALASTKAYRDALAKHLGCDDNQFKTLGARMEADPEEPHLELIIAHE
jgi:crossover junction endodeoxyribonuclease RusA